MNNTGVTLYCVGMAQNQKYCYLEVAETDSVVVEIPKLFLAGEQVRDELANVNKMQTSLEGSVVKAPSLVSLQKNCWTVNTFMKDWRVISRRITEIKLSRS